MGHIYKTAYQIAPGIRCRYGSTKHFYFMEKISLKDRPPIVMNFSGGRSSALALHYIMPHFDKERDIIVFNNTGKEMPETLFFVEQVANYYNVKIVWLEYFHDGEKQGYRIVDFETSNKNGKPFSDLITNKKKGFLPNIVTRYCTEYLKIKPTQWFLQDCGIKEKISVLGIRFDEPERYRKNKDKHFMPLYELGITKDYVRQFWVKMPFDLNLKDYEGNCDLCYLKGKYKRLTIIKDHPHLAEWWINQEKINGGTFDKQLSVEQMLLISKTKKFKTAIDHMDLGTIKLFDDITCFCGT